MKRESYRTDITVLGVTMSLRQWAAAAGCDHSVIARRIRRGERPTDAVFSCMGERFRCRAYYQANAAALKAKRRARYRAKALGKPVAA